jgi:hypothetical protein
MRYWLAIVGIGVAVATNHWLPTIFPELSKASGFASGFVTLGGLLTASWAVCLSKLSVFEKLDDLPTHSREKVLAFSGRTRRCVITTVIVNVLLAVFALSTVFFSQITSVVSHPLLMPLVLCVTLGYWAGGLFDSWRLYQAIETSREALLIAQVELKKRTGYVAKMRKDATDSPIGKGDSHLGGYSTNV